VNSLFVDRIMMGAFSSLKWLARYASHSRIISSACACIAECAGLRILERQEIALTGLLHDVGRLVLAVAADATLLSRVRTEGLKFSEVALEENELWGIDHCQIGAMLCAKWSFPETIIAGIRERHARPARDGYSRTAVFIYIAHLLTTRELAPEMTKRSMPPWVWEDLGLVGERFDCAAEDARKLTA